jgi:hypothetical protein
MSGPSRKGKPRRRAAGKSPKSPMAAPAGESTSSGRPESSPGAGLPAPESIISEHEFTSPKGRKYRIIRTTETDPDNEPEPPKKK